MLPTQSVIMSPLMVLAVTSSPLVTSTATSPILLMFPLVLSQLVLVMMLVRLLLMSRTMICLPLFLIPTSTTYSYSIQPPRLPAPTQVSYTNPGTAPTPVSCATSGTAPQLVQTADASFAGHLQSGLGHDHNSGYNGLTMEQLRPNPTVVSEANLVLAGITTAVPPLSGMGAAMGNSGLQRTTQVNSVDQLYAATTVNKQLRAYEFATTGQFSYKSQLKQDKFKIE